MKNNLQKISIIFALILTLVFPLYGFANEDTLNFSVNIMQPENQIDKEASYFDVHVTPNHKQKLELQITNSSTEKQTFNVVPTNATTNTNGIVDYSIKNQDYIYDDSLTTPFTSLVGNSQSIEIDAGKTEIVSFDLKAPSTEFDGIILGGFVVYPHETENNADNNSDVTFINKFQLIKAVVLRSSDRQIEPIIQVNDIRPSLYSYRTAVSINIQNITPLLLGNVKIDASITEKGKKEVIKQEIRTDIELAPHSNFDFPVMWDNEALKAGDYNAIIIITIDNKEYQFNKEFNISSEDSYQVNNGAMDLNEPTKFFPIWLPILIILLVCLLAVSAVLYKEKNKKKKKGKSKK